MGVNQFRWGALTGRARRRMIKTQKPVATGVFQTSVQLAAPPFVSLHPPTGGFFMPFHSISLLTRARTASNENARQHQLQHGGFVGKVFESITEAMHRFILEQPMFFVATAPLAADSHVNLSPKGMDSFRILAPNRVAYLDFTGSGNETSAHIAENGRITFMFCAFTGAPMIVRLYGTGATVLPESAEWESLRALFPAYPGIRQIITAEITRTATSCGYGVPLMDLVDQRNTMIKWAEAKGEDGLVAYRAQKNESSIDGLPTPLAR